MIESKSKNFKAFQYMCVCVYAHANNYEDFTKKNHSLSHVNNLNKSYNQYLNHNSMIYQIKCTYIK